MGKRILTLAMLVATACDGESRSRRDAGESAGAPDDAAQPDLDASNQSDTGPSPADAAVPEPDAKAPPPFYDPPFTEDEGAGERELGAAFEPEDPSMPGLGTSLARVEARGAAAQIRYLKSNPSRPESVWKLHRGILEQELVTDPASGAQYAVLEVEGRRVLVCSGNAPAPDVEADFTLRTTETELAGLDVVLAYLGEQGDAGEALSLALLELQVPETGAVVGSNQFAPMPLSEEPSCVEQALMNLDLPDLDFHIPPVQGCSKERCVQAVEAWLMSHYSVYRVRQMLEYMAEHSAEKRANMWKQYPTSKEGGALLPPASPDYWDHLRFEDWFGGYEDYRFEAIRRTYGRLWSRLRTGKIADTTVRLKCPDPHDEPGNVCFTAKPNAHHFVVGYVNLCDDFFVPDAMALWRTHVLMHELLHHTWVEWKENNLWKGYVLTDNHTHGHGNTCLSSVTTEPMYNELARHLATYKAENGNTCWHRNYALRNPDSYANMAANIGHAVYDGDAVSWPHPPPSPPAQQGPNPCDGESPIPNPGPPFQSGANDCQKVGGELLCPHPGTEHGVVELLDALELFPVCP